jgi:hypothetical protein
MAGPKKTKQHDTVIFHFPPTSSNKVRNMEFNTLDNQIMARAVMLPISNFNPGTPRLDGVEPRLKQMIANSDALDSQVR